MTGQCTVRGTGFPGDSLGIVRRHFHRLENNLFADLADPDFLAREAELVGQLQGLVPPLRAPCHAALQGVASKRYGFATPFLVPKPVSCHVHGWFGPIRKSHA